MNRPNWYTVMAVLLSSLMTGVAAVAISLHSQAESERDLLQAQRESQRQFCDIVIAQDDAWSETTPTTVTGQRVAAAIAKLRRDLDCPAP